MLCPTLATYVIDIYSQPARLFITGGEELISAKGTKQGDPLSISLYAIILQPLDATVLLKRSKTVLVC